MNACDTVIYEMEAVDTQNMQSLDLTNFTEVRLINLITGTE
jgi:hypothetical protein